MSSVSLKTTPLHAAHLQLGAKMVDFGGWEMPVYYGSQIEEHHAVRKDAGMFDVSHMQAVDISGSDAKAFLQRLLANDVAKLTVPGKAIYSCMLNEQGGVIDDLIVYYFTPDSWRAVVNAGTAQTDIAWMQKLAKDESFSVSIVQRHDLALVAVQGPNAQAKLAQARPAWTELLNTLTPFVAAYSDAECSDAEYPDAEQSTLIARTGYTGEDGFEIILPATQVVALWEDLAAQGVTPCGLGARDTLRLEAGMNLYGQEMNEQVNPLIAGLAWTVSFKDEARQFVGREALQAAVADQTLVGVKLLERGVMRSHMKLRTAQGEGEMTSGSMSPTLGVSIGMARVPVGAQPGDAAEVEIRGKWLSAQITKMPFVRNGKILS